MWYYDSIIVFHDRLLQKNLYPQTCYFDPKNPFFPISDPQNVGGNRGIIWAKIVKFDFFSKNDC